MAVKKLIYFDWFGHASEFYRLAVLDYIRHPQLEITRSTERNITWATLNPYDIIVISRPSDASAISLIKLAKDMQKVIIMDYDDNVMHIQPDNPMYGHYNNDKKNIIQAVAICDAVWVATPEIKKSFRLYSNNIHVIPNSWNDQIFPVKDKKPFTYNKIAMWRGGFSHMGDIYQDGIVEWMLKMINGNKTWKFYMLGQRFEWLEKRLKHPNYFRNDGASTVQFYKLMQEINPSVFYYPLRDDLFNRGKSNCSWLESVYSGAAYFGMNQFPEFDKPGVGALRDLKYLLKGNHASELEEMNQESWAYIADNLLLSTVNNRRVESLEKFL